MIENWRLVSDVTFMIENTGDGNKIYIASPEKKQYEAEVMRLSRDIYKTITVENKDFEIKLEGDGSIYIKTNNVPELGWAEVMNFYKPSIWNIIKQSKLNNGVIDSKFQIAFSDSDIKTMTFVSQGMSEYRDCLNEMTRRISCEFGKKTKSLKPGHRYDLLKETRYYICPVLSRRSCVGSSDFLDDVDINNYKSYIYVNQINPSYTTISDVLKNNKFGTGPYDLKVAISENSTWIDNGEKLKNDFSGNIKDYWESITNNAINQYKHKVEDSENYYTCADKIKEILDVFSCQSDSDISFTINESLKDIITKVINEKLEYDILMFWKMRNKDEEYEISDIKTPEENTKSLIRIFFKTIYDENIEKFNYYQKLIQALNIDLQKLASFKISTFNESELSDTFEDYIKYKFFWENKKFLYSTKQILDFSVNRLGEKKESVRNILPGEDLWKIVCDLFNNANSNYGIGVDYYRVNSCYKNTLDKKSEPDVFCKITLQDIIKYKKGVSGMSEILKNEIKNIKFSTIVINCKKSDILD